ncbi:MOSC domain-containing protein [Alginatibacterium sediminis]|uniref:MOSC domain-containing protein n=1 Tax=Alginatibacterium sediminis TaxID=2164068 RepID=A0A420E8R2_9ALTE|nr:MOSC N-terminal beta barrel domain-containing protein [Alginatibacterium sediminis]RKF15767.1 MOSC domain-containing protein [Alginatibacterium sediminis]
MPYVSNLTVYPIKSCSGNDVASSKVGELGLEYDRTWLISDRNGAMFTGRTHPKITQLRVSTDSNACYLIIPNQAPIALESQAWDSAIDVDVWSSSINALSAPSATNLALSEFLGVDCVLSVFTAQSQRKVKNRQSQVAFADAYPILIVSQSSLDELNRRSPETINMAQFRPNIVVQGTEAFAEDHWKRIRIAGVEYELCGPSSRCIFTTLKPGTEHYDANKEPLTTLKSFRLGNSGDVYFGENAVALGEGNISIGDDIEILETKVPEHYPELEVQSATSSTTNSEASVSILFDSWDLSVQGNTVDTLLDQAEDAGLDIPFSCRSGSCGTCKVKLESGEVEVLEDSGLTPQESDEGYILSCSCLPKTDLVITAG